MKRRVFLIFLAVLSSFNWAGAQQQKRLTSDWEFLKQDLGGIWEAVRPVAKGSSEAVPLWEPVTLPHSFNAEDAVDPDMNYYQGPGWYRTKLPLENPYPGGRILLHFEGAGQKTDVYVYTTKVGSHTGGYDEWTVDITDAVAQFQKLDVFNKQFKGSVPISIRSDNSRDLEMIPSDLSDFNLYGGIYRYLNLVYAPALSVERLFIKPELRTDLKAGKIDVRARYYDPTSLAGADITVRLKDPDGKLLATVKKSLKSFDEKASIAEFSVKSPFLWSPDKPQLYTVETELLSAAGKHIRTEKVGFRSFEFKEHGPFMLNNKRVLLKGTHRHEDHAGVAAAMTEDMIRTEMQMMKDMGVNFIRLGHYQQSPIVLDLCDSLGIMVWEEIPWCRGGLGGDIYKDQARRMLTNMIEQHYNHPSVIIWGLGNENDWPGDFSAFDKEAIRSFMAELNDLSHQLDPSRKTAIRRCDFCKDIVDVYSPSIWAGWYRGVYTDYKKVSEEENKRVKHFFHAEWGGDSHARRHSEDPDNALRKVKSSDGADERAGDASLYGGQARISKDGDWSESYMSNLIDWHLKEQETMPWLSGSAYWPFKDFSTPVRPENPVPYVNQKGVVERDFTKKESYYIFQSYWTSKPMVHIYGHSWPVRWGNEGEEKMVKVYSNADQAELFLNGKSFGVKVRNSQDFPAAGLRWNLPFVAGKNTVKVIATKGKIRMTDEISFDYETRKWTKPAKLVIHKTSEDDGIATLEARIYDAAGVQCLDNASLLKFSLSGDGELIDNQGTSTGSRNLQLYNGRGIIKVKLNKGRSTVSAKVEGVETAFINL
ncbi:beta-galactosidase [Arcticibacter pallidicorallinus]|uniref:Beta-galactosidase n=1 Tax=Arcticibacter pallidicorallinus TaxID=1259464 RepID=A0A2T0U6Q0_9SPHI|nr:glycoside hydrolase family 2 TIM barrel-domain containing protein [Arcticibacter pallidicorallinus]PRY53591.1 beta-galactosidase [Arcticibacter pallidicorallinus]